MNADMLYEELETAPAARSIAACYWRFRLGEGASEALEHVIVPDGTTSLSVAVSPMGASPLLCAGPTRKAHVVQVHAGVFYGGVRLTPAAGAVLLGVDGPSLRGRIGPWFDGDNQLGGLASALVELARTGATGPADALLSEFAARVRLDPAAALVARDLIGSGGRGRISDLAAEANLSERQLRRRFFEATGLTPKEFAGIRRLREACILAAAAHETWAAAAAEADYADQAHLSRDVRMAFAQTPRRVARYLRRIEHRFVS